MNIVEWAFGKRMTPAERLRKHQRSLEKTQRELERERVKLEKTLGGIKNMSGLPGAVFIIDPKKEHIAVEEARKLEIPIVAITDTNSNPDLVDYPIAGNDDAIRSISIILEALNDAVIEGSMKAGTLGKDSVKPAEEESLTGVSA